MGLFAYLMKVAGENLTSPSSETAPTLSLIDQQQEFKTQSGDMSYVKNNDCWEVSSHAVNAHGYPVVWRDGKQHYAHRLSYADSKGPIPEGMVLRHTCDNRKCVNPDHLIPGTQLENIADRVARNRSAFGTANGRAKLNDDQVREILKDTTTPKIQLARQYGVDAKMIRNIKNRVNWGHISVD